MSLVPSAVFCLALLLTIGPAMAQTANVTMPPTTNIVVNPDPDMPPIVQLPAYPTPAGGWAGQGQHQFGPSYEMYVPVEIKSNTPEVEHSFGAAGAPLNGNGQTGSGQACVADADCMAPYGCFNRADSGQIPVKQCAMPPGR